MITLSILYCDENIIVVDKPGGLLAVPGRGPEKQDCVVSRVRRIIPDMPKQPAPHRLDMFTSGLMVLARTKDAHRNLSIQFEKKQVHKRYIALLDGILQSNSGRIELKFRLDPDNRPYQVYDPTQGKLGITNWKLLKREGQYTRIEFHPETGRTHQLRLHASHKKGLGLPIVGDTLYGNGEEGAQMCLHAQKISFLHPFTGNQVCFSSAVPF